MTHITPPRDFARRLRRDKSGAAAVEFGLIASLLTCMLIPTFDLGMGAYTKMRVQNAAEAGAQYALANTYSSSAITTAAQSATSLGTNAAVTPAQSCNCITGTGSAAVLGPTVGCGSACSDGTTAGTYVTVATSTVYSPLIAYSIPGLTIGSTITLSGTAVVRTN